MLGTWWWLACAPSPPASPPPEVDPRRGDTLVVGFGFDPGNLNPLVLPYAASFALSDLVNPGLVRRIDGFEPALATSWTWSEDRSTLTYTLRDSLQWEDGRPLTSDDVVFSWSLIADPAVASNWHGSAKHVASVDAPDPLHVRYTFAAQRNPVLQQGVTVRGVVSQHLLADADRGSLRGHDSARQPIASGPFRVAAWEPNARVVLERNPHAPADWAPHLDRIIVRILPEYATRVIALERGTLDLLTDVEVRDLPRLSSDPRLRIERSASDAMVYAGWNLAHPPFDDVRVRRAMTLAVDRDRLIEQVLAKDDQRYGQPCVGTVSPRYPGWVPDDLVPLPFDPAQATTLLAEAGLTDTDGDGLVEHQGQPFKPTLLIQTGSAELADVAVRLQARLAAVGVGLQIDRVEPVRFSERARDKDFEAILWGFGANPVVDPSIQWRSDGQYNWMGLADPEIDAWIDRGVHAGTVEEAQAAFHEVQRRVYAAQPATFLFWKDGIIAVDRRFQDTQHDSYSPLRHAERWWVPADQRRY